MFSLALVGWWYTAGWKWAVRQFLVNRLSAVAEFFSMGAILKTLFAPFRQDSVLIKNAPPGQVIQAFGANLVSRLIGFVIRITLLIFGAICAFLTGVFGLVVVILWPLVPVTSVIAIILVLRKVGQA